MRTLLRGLAILLASAAAAHGPIPAASAGPLARPVAVMPVRSMPVRIGHTGGAQRSLLRSAAALPALGLFARRRAAIPIQPIALVFKPPPPQLAIVLPRFAFLALTAPLQRASCPGGRRPGRIEVLAAMPFDSTDCARPAIDDAALPPTSLVAGHNRNALYGPAYTPSSADLH